MEKLKHLSLEDRLSFCGCNTRSPLSDSIPHEVFMDIISRLPAKSIANCRRLSKLWASILRRPEFDKLFLTKSLTCPLILFAFEVDRRLPFFTSPDQLQDPDHEDSSLVATPHTYLPSECFYKISQPVRGWVCFEDQKGIVICNPITGDSVTLPKLKTKVLWAKSVLGYDPIAKQLKVLCTTCSPHHPLNTPGDHHVLTLGTEKKIWRKIECCKPLRPVSGGGICIKGVLYYIAMLNCYPQDIVIVCFDVRYEKLSLIHKPKDMGQLIYQYSRSLINHKGQLGILQCSNSSKIDGSTTSFELWVLEDATKYEWTKHIYVLPLLWRSMVANTELCIVGMTCTREIVFSPRYLSNPFYIFYYNLEKNIVRRVKIRGFEAFEISTKAHLFLDYVEDVKFI